MDFLNKQNIYFLLHDCFIDNIESTDFGLCLKLNNGIFILNENADYNLSKSCKLNLFIDNFMNHEDCHVSIFKFNKSKRKDVSYKEFKCMLRKNKLHIYLDFYSDFAKAIYIKGEINNNEVELCITEINDLKIEL